MTWGAFYLWLADRLKQRENGINEARWLIEAVTGLSFYSIREQPFAEATRPRFEKALVELFRGRPFQYVVGSQDFYGYSFKVGEGVLVPRPETELLVEAALQWGKGRELRALDLCTGSGCIAIVLAKHLRGDFTAVDLSADALSVARENGILLDVDVHWEQGDLFAPVEGKMFHLITANPPYLSEEEMAHCPIELTYEPSMALVAGSDGLEVCRRIIGQVSNYLERAGLFLMEFGETQGAAILEQMKKGDWQKVKIRKDYQGKDRFLYAIR